MGGGVAKPSLLCIAGAHFKWCYANRSLAAGIADKLTSFAGCDKRGKMPSGGPR